MDGPGRFNVSELCCCWLVVVVGIGVKVGVGVRFFETTDRRKKGKGEGGKKGEIRRVTYPESSRVGTLKFYTIYLESE